MDLQQQRRELALRAGIERQLDDIVREANATAALFEGSGLQKSPMRNVLNVAQQHPEAQLVADFVRYQVGRCEPDKDWRHNNVGLRVIAAITAEHGAVPKAVMAAVSTAKTQWEQWVSNSERQEPFEQWARQQAGRKLLQLYMGYLHRALYFAIETGHWDELRPKKEAP